MLNFFSLQTQTVAGATDELLKTGNSWMTKLQDFIMDYGPKIIGAIIVYIIGKWIIRKLINIIRKGLEHKKFEPSLSRFLLSVCNVTFLLLLFLSIAGILGINVMGFSAILAGIAVGVGAALNGSLGNLAGGVMMMIFKPFKVGDIIAAQDKTGTVQELGIFNTIILTSDNKTVILPNGPLSTGVITNYRTAGYLRVDLEMAIALDQDIDKAREVALRAMNSHPKVLKTPAAEFAVSSISDFMIKIAIRPYTIQEDYWDVYFGVTEAVKKAFDAHQIAGPTPTRIVYNK